MQIWCSLQSLYCYVLCVVSGRKWLCSTHCYTMYQLNVIFMLNLSFTIRLNYCICCWRIKEPEFVTLPCYIHILPKRKCEVLSRTTILKLLVTIWNTSDTFTQYYLQIVFQEKIFLNHIYIVLFKWFDRSKYLETSPFFWIRKCPRVPVKSAQVLQWPESLHFSVYRAATGFFYLWHCYQNTWITI